MTEILQFPKNKIIREIPVDNEKLEKTKQKSVTNFAENILNEIAHEVAMELDNAGIDTQSEQFLKDYMIVVDFLRATIYRQMDIKHHLHEVMDTSVKTEKLEDMEFYNDIE